MIFAQEPDLTPVRHANVRPARRDDATDLARLINMAGEGLPLHFWGQMAEEGRDAWDIGRERAGRDHGGFSWRNAFIAEQDSAVAAALVTYPIGDEPEPIGDGFPAVFVPLQELENLAPGTQYVNVLATYRPYWGQGHGSRLLQRAGHIAEGRRLSIIVSEANVRALALYERHGYREVARRPIVMTDGWRCSGENWLLMMT